MKDETRLVHRGRNSSDQHGFVNPPLYRGSTVLFDSVEQLRNPQTPYVYGRHNTPTMAALTGLMCELEQGELCKLAPSGLAAITTALLSYVASGDHILVADSVYFPTRHFCDTTLKAMGITTTYYDPTDCEALEARIIDNTVLIFTESPGSGTFEMQDMPRIVEIARKRDLLVLIDNTWATPLYYKPLVQGVDVSIHAGTKYITGHSDAFLGLITAGERAAAKLDAGARALGTCPGSEEVYAGLRGLRTLGTRLSRHYESALVLANWLQQRDEVEKVLYPALPGFDGHEIWARDFSGASGLFSIVLKPCEAASLSNFFNSLKLFGMGWSWGGYESLAVPVKLQGARTASPLFEAGPVVRLHAGLEDVDDLQEDLEGALAQLRSPA